ncbi:MAG: hypothetical protein FVQ79_10070 [Planctomycetes bacterium]|nr:hypothetical protein [Planctomycetota bacterium]
MEIQSFLLCRELRKVGSGNEYDANLICLHSFYSLDGRFPLEFSLPYYMLLRRKTREGDETFSLRFNLIDSDGNRVGEPKDVKAISTFPNGHMFMSLQGTIHFSFPEIGDYRLDITADEEKFPFIFQYNIEVTENPN